MTKDVPYTMRDYLDVVRRRWIIVVALMTTSVLVAVYLAFALPPLYRSSATVMLEPSSIPQEMIRTTVTAYADQQLDLVRRRVLTTDNLRALIADIDPYPDRRDLDIEGKAREISENTRVERVDPITLEPLVESNAFSIHYLNPTPELARSVTEHLADMFLSFNRSNRTQAATDTHELFRRQAGLKSDEIIELEHQLAEFKAKYGDALPATQERNKELLDRAERNLDVLNRQLILARDRQRTLEVQLSTINPNQFDPNGNWRMELQAAQQELAIARQTKSELHPDVRRLTAVIEAMSARVDTSGRGVRPTNPEYITVASQLDTARSELASLEAEAARTRQQMSEYEASLEMTPEVEREYSALTRRYESAKQELRDIQQSLSAAAMGQLVETEQRGDRLTLIRRADSPRLPDSPNRLGIVLLGFVLGGALSVGAAAVLESSDATVRNVRDLGDITDIKPLATVPLMLNDADRRSRMLGWSAASIVAVVALVIVGTTVMQAT